MSRRVVHFAPLPLHRPHSFHYSGRDTVNYDPPFVRPRIEVRIDDGPPRISRPSEREIPASIPNFLFCVEMGMLVRSRRSKHKEARSLMDEISFKLRETGIVNHVQDKYTERSENHRDWTIIEDLTIPKPTNYRYALKIVSPFFRFGPGQAETWIPMFDVVMSVLNCSFETTTNHHCATHVHVVPSRGHWKLAEAKKLACAAVYFERCFDALVPPYRRRTVWAKSNRYNKYLGRRSITECADAIQHNTDTFPGLVARMNWCDGDSATAKAIGKIADFPHETYRWNFTGLDADGHGTVEFRQPPGVTDAAEVIKWIMLVGCFARLSCAFYVVPERRPEMASLGKFVRYEARLCGISHRYVARLKRMFEYAGPVHFKAALVRDAESITGDEGQRIRWLEMVQWSAGQEKFKDWLRYQRGKRIQ